jgi:hypothetical protein
MIEVGEAESDMLTPVLRSDGWSADIVLIDIEVDDK